MRFYKKECDPNQLSPLNLAFVGDCVYEIYVREKLVCEANRPVNDLHAESVKQVNATAQRAAVQRLLPHLSEKELAVFKRGRNAKTNHIPKNKNAADYHYSTGFECLVGYLYLSDNTERILELFKLINE